VDIQSKAIKIRDLLRTEELPLCLSCWFNDRKIK